jgi:dUTP pyrophosphatase
MFCPASFYSIRLLRNSKMTDSCAGSTGSTSPEIMNVTPSIQMATEESSLLCQPKPISIKILLTKEAKANGIPQYQTTGAAGMDLRSVEAVTIPPGDRMLVRTGITMEIPQGMEGQIRPRSGLALKRGLTVLNSPGTIDSDYRGGVCVLLYNTTNQPQSIEIGERIAQIVFAPVTRVQLVEADQLTVTARGAGGYGSTGTK